MNRIAVAAASTVAVALLACASALAGETTAGKPVQATPQQVARGKYLVEQVAMCIDCHSPRDEKGQFVRARWLHGTPLDFKNTVPMPKWAPIAPPIAGLPGWTAEQGVTFLMTGKAPDGELPDPPMPLYRMNRDDAVAVVAYLKSLPPPGGN
jgi:mono/diheme cytochrome c family protein